MSDLFVHIGLPKTGSTTLQEKVFRSVPGYLGIKAEKKEEDDLGKQFASLVPRESDFLMNDGKIAHWMSDVITYKKLHCPSADRLIVSNEDLSNRAIAPFLDVFSNKCWTEGKVKALLIVRNQPEWLCSNYSQLSKRISHASQEHFENQVRKLIEKGYIEDYFERNGYNDHFGSNVLGFDSYYLDWSRRVKDLHNALGPENVCVLLLEEMGTEKFWSKMKHYLQIPDLNTDRISPASSAENVRRTATNVWKISPWNGDSLTMETFNHIWPSDRLPTIRQKAAGIVRRTSKAIHKKRGTEIRLTDPVRKQIRDFCRPFNRRLSELFGEDLEDLGY